MFRMKIDVQLNLDGRTLIGGVAEYDVIPPKIQIQKRIYEVVGVSYGAKLPKISLEIEQTKDDLKDQIATAYYDYNISKEYNRKIFKETVDLLMKNIKTVEKPDYFEDSFDGDQIQTLKTNEGNIVIINEYMVGAVWVESEMNLDHIFKTKNR